jgi:hypothetical protein
MTRKTKAISGASVDAYFGCVLGEFPDLTGTTRDALLARLRQDIAQMRVRTSARSVADAGEADRDDEAAQAVASVSADAAAEAEADPVVSFDPFALNVIVTLRQQGRDAALEALNAIADAEKLRLLAREQRLSIDDGLASSAELSAAIVSAAERRLANRRAAANAH